MAERERPGAGSVVLNVLWLVLSGIWLFLAYAVAGLVQLVTLIGIPFGIQSFKVAAFALWPFGREVVRAEGRSGALRVVGNVVWFLLAGWWLALAHALIGLVLCLTVIGIPLGVGNFKLIPLAVLPFGKEVVEKGTGGDRVLASF
jgi:uncharacterized membrane protein YccF (DUF307 family)